VVWKAALSLLAAGQDPRCIEIHSALSVTVRNNPVR
jgi:hypothetical protein